MNDCSYAEIALNLAIKAHKGQKDKGGVDYIHHPITVAYFMDTDEEKAVAYLHDVVEDTKITFSDLEELFPDEIVDALKAITKVNGEKYEDYLKRVSKNRIAKK